MDEERPIEQGPHLSEELAKKQQRAGRQRYEVSGAHVAEARAGAVPAVLRAKTRRTQEFGDAGSQPRRIRHPRRTR